jgi:hypothetical protein
MSVRVPALLLGLVTACSPSVELSSDAPSAVDAPIVRDAVQAPAHVRYRGMLSSTPSVQFGGGQYCTYSVQMRSIVFDAVVRDAESLTSMSVDNTMTEGIVGSCPYPPFPASQQHFSQRSPAGVRSDGSFSPVLVGDSANQPRADLTSLVTLRGDTLQATARWERTDAEPPLKWIVMTAGPVTLEPQRCDPGAFVCVGGNDGSLYLCEDGLQMSLVRPCAAGCAPSQRECN